MFDPDFLAIAVKKQSLEPESAPTSSHCTREQREWGMRQQCAGYANPVILLKSNISIPWCPWPMSHDLLLMQTALLASLLSIITKPQAKLHNVHAHTYYTAVSTLKCKALQLRIVKSVLTGHHQAAVPFHSSSQHLQTLPAW